MNRKIFGNPIGQFFLILAEIAGLAGAGYFIFKVITVIGFENFAAAFEGDKVLLSTYAITCMGICVPFLLVALIATIVGLAAKKRAVGVLSVIFVVIGLLLQAIAFIIGFGDVANYFSKVDWSQFFQQGSYLITFAYYLVIIGFILDIIAIICAAARKRPGAVVCSIIGLICLLGAAFFYIWPLFGNPAAGEVFVLFEAIAPGQVTTVPFVGVIFLIVRGAFLALVGLAIFFLSCARVKAKAAAGSKAEVRHEEKAEKKEDKKSDNPNPNVDIIEKKDRIIIEIR